MGFLRNIGDFFHYLATGEEEGGRHIDRSAPEPFEPPEGRGFLGFFRRAVKAAHWIVEQVTTVIDTIVEAVSLVRTVVVAVAEVLSATPLTA